MLLETSSRTLTARGADVSGGGISVRTEAPLAIGDRVDLYFELPIGLGVEVRAEVVRVADGVVALRFVDPAYETVLAIRSFCRVSGLTPAAPPSAR